MSVIQHLKTLGVYLSGKPDFRFAINGHFRFKNTITAITTAGAGTLTAAQLLAGLINRDPAGAARTDTTPTATAIVNALGLGVVVGSTFDVVYRNTGSLGEVITLAGGTDVTLAPTVITLDADEVMILRFIVTNKVTPAVTAYLLSTSADQLVSKVEVVTDDRTIVAADHGTTFLIGTDAKTFDLPAVVLGLEYSFINIGAAGNNIITINPVTADGINGSISNSQGANADATTADGLVVVASGAANKDFVNTKTTANPGDRVTLIGGAGTDWWIKDGVGLWASEG